MDYEEMIKILTDGGMTRDEAQRFIELENRAAHAGRPDAQRAAVAEWRDIAAVCSVVGAPKLASRFLQAGLSLRACREMLMMNVTVKGAKPLTMTPAACEAVSINLLALAHNRGRLAA